MIATLFEGIPHHSSVGFWFKRYAEQHGFHAAVDLEVFAFECRDDRFGGARRQR
jgi:hypothetical protein